MSDTPPGRSPWRGFMVNLSLVVLLVVSAAFTGLVVSDQRAIEAELLTRGRSLFGSIVLAYKWNAGHGGVLVEKRSGMVSNPFLENPDRRGDDGTVYTRKNPELMTREISEIAERDGAFRFHITRLKPLNPGNAPDEFERDALASFDRGATEATGRERIDGEPWFRYMAPLKVNASCHLCHDRQGYRVGDVRGGISVSFSMAGAEAAIHKARWMLATLFTISSVLLILLVGRMVRGLQRQVVAAEARIRELAITDELTGLPNRRHTAERLREEGARAERYGRPMSVALFDVDHFKRVNDTHGHDAGDAVLRAVARAGRAALREADVLGRWGGEEFLVVLPETDAVGVRILAGRLREAIETLTVEHGGLTLRVTVSAGLATWAPTVPTSRRPDDEALLKLADDALYRAKAGGRNRVEAWGAPGPLVP